MKNNILVSIITVCFNSQKTIKETIDSVMNQSYENIEYIIIDGGSTDNTINIIRSYLNENKITIISEKDNGIYDAMNKGIKLASGDLIGIINSDDWYEKDAVKKVVRAYKTSTDKNTIITGDLVWCNDNGKIIKYDKASKNYKKDIFFRMCINHPSTFVSRSVYLKNGNYDTSFKIAADYDFIYRAILSNIKIIVINKLFSYMRIGGISSFHNRKNVIKERLRVLVKNKDISTLNIFYQYIKYKELLIYYLIIFKNKIVKLLTSS